MNVRIAALAFVAGLSTAAALVAVALCVPWTWLIP